jgi:glycerol-3-phosphate acyltransferase PlsY
MLPGLLGTGFTSAHATASWGIAFGAAAIAGHMKPLFLLGKGGGKGVATAAGVFLALTPLATFAALAVFVAVVGSTRFISLGSMLGAVVMPVAQLATAGVTPVFYASLAIAVLVCWAHRANITRLRAGTEPKFGRPGKVQT